MAHLQLDLQLEDLRELAETNGSVVRAADAACDLLAEIKRPAWGQYRADDVGHTCAWRGRIYPNLQTRTISNRLAVVQSCPRCNGEKTCTECKGSGSAVVFREYVAGTINTESVVIEGCRACSGSGHQIKDIGSLHRFTLKDTLVVGTGECGLCSARGVLDRTAEVIKYMKDHAADIDRHTRAIHETMDTKKRLSRAAECLTGAILCLAAPLICLGATKLGLVA
eukprot:TRINITY_DN5002_c0_g1_i1.p2 TRINITY_DN5002_c0_g1~~TRINITY_DN5002_c0_g1_i1.p2  ORF type:complete len:224 (+),score=31.64 TRINITY_DN5002_c0_g1_i1:20-691(+)